MTTRPYFRHTIDQLEAMPTDAALIAELELRTTPRARKLLAKLKAGTATAPKIDASPVPVPVEKREPVTKGKRPAKGIARPGAAVAPPAPIGKHPGVAPHRWEDLTDAQHAWWYGLMPWLFDGRTPVHSPAEYLEWMKRGEKLCGVGKRKRAKIPAGKRYAEWSGQWEQACFLPGRWDWITLARHRKQDPAGWSRITSSQPQPVLEHWPSPKVANEQYKAAKAHAKITKRRLEPETVEMLLAA